MYVCVCILWALNEASVYRLLGGLGGGEKRLCRIKWYPGIPPYHHHPLPAPPPLPPHTRPGHFLPPRRQAKSQELGDMKARLDVVRTRMRESKVPARTLRSSKGKIAMLTVDQRERERERERRAAVSIQGRPGFDLVRRRVPVQMRARC